MLRSAFRQLRGNVGAFVLALLLAFVIWIAASLQTNPFSDRRYAGVPLVSINQPGNAVLMAPLAEQVVVTARAREGTHTDLRSTSFQATIDLAHVQPGAAASVPVVVTCGNPEVRIVSVDPPLQSVDLAWVESITLPVTVELQGRVSTGFGIGEATVSPEAVEVRGPRPNLSKVVSVTTSIDVEGVRRPITATVSLRLLDAAGSSVSGLEVKPAQVQVHVPVRSLAQFKPDVKVVPIVRGDPAPGYRRGDVTVVPPVVTLEGPSWVLDGLPDFVETLPITITGATESLSRQSLITVPLEVDVVEVSYVTVTVEVLPILGTRAMTGTVEMLRVPPGMKAAPLPEVVTVTLEGPDARLASLKPENLLIVLDLRGFTPGVRRVRPEVLVPEGVSVLSVDPETIVVVIEPLAPPTAVPTPIPTSTPRPQ